jgi:hypothetical protein
MMQSKVVFAFALIGAFAFGSQGGLWAAESGSAPARSGATQGSDLNPALLHELDGDNKIDALGGATAGDLKGADIIGQKGDKIGDVDKILATSDNKPVAVLAEAGGFLGIGATSVLVPLTQLKYDAGKKDFRAELTKDQLKSMRKVTRGPRGNLE